MVAAASSVAPALEIDPSVRMQPLPVVSGNVEGAVNVATPWASVVTVRREDGQPVAPVTVDDQVPVTVADETGAPVLVSTTVKLKEQVTCTTHTHQGTEGEMQKRCLSVSRLCNNF